MQPSEKDFVNIIEKNQNLIHKVCSMYCQDSDDKKDLFQEIVLQLWRAFPSFKKESKVSTWMYQIALNTAITQLRNKYKKPNFEAITQATYSIAEKQTDDFENNYGLLYQVINQLSDIEKAIIVLYLEEHSNEQIAEIMGITQNNVRVKLHRIQEKIKKKLTAKNYERA